MLHSNTHIIAKILNLNYKDLASVDFKGVYTDTRKTINGGLFIALKGDNFNGADYVKQAQDCGVVAIIANKKVKTDLPSIIVDDTKNALTTIAKWHLNNISPTKIAITGSNGKTTTKNMLKNILNLQAPTLATKGNLNNHIGVPLTLLELEKKHQYAVIEMGANHLGEIEYLRNIVKPDIAIVTNTLDAHIGEFGGFDNLVKTKGEIYSKNSKNIVNTTTSFKGDISFGKNGDVFATDIKDNKFNLNIENKKTAISLQLLGVHNIENALAAAACAYSLGVDISLIKRGLEKTKAEKGRLNIIKKKGLTIIDDSYNASPSSTKYALDVLAGFKGEKIAVLGDMAELGDKSFENHSKIGKHAKTLNIDYLYSIGENSKNYQIKHFDNISDLIKRLKTHTNATMLFKGSRVAKLEQLIKKI